MILFRIQFITALCLISFELESQATIGLLSSTPENEEGYVLFAPNSSTTTYLIDKCGYKVHSWPGTRQPGMSVYLLEDGHLLRPGKLNNSTFAVGGVGGIIEKIDWEGNVVWSYSISSNLECQHHDIHPMPNGNVLAIVFELKTVAQATDAGRDPALLGNSFWSEKIVEIQPSGTNGGTIVWEWHVWDHLVQSFDASKANYAPVAEHPELLDINFGGGTASDWLHLNGLDYNEELDQIVMSSRNRDEIWIIDHSTTTAEAATHSGGNSGRGGDFLFRWGNPQVYGQGTAADQTLFAQHNPTWIKQGFPDEGKLMVFNNGMQRPGGNYSTVDVIKPATDASGAYVLDASGMFLPQATSWMYSPTPTFYAMNISGSQRLANGNTLICSGPQGTFIEVDYEGNTVWSYKSPSGQLGAIATQGGNVTQNSVFRCTHYPVDYPGFNGHDLTPGAPIELNPLAYDCNMLALEVDELEGVGVGVYPNPASEYLVAQLQEHNTLEWQVELFDMNGKVIQALRILPGSSGAYFDLHALHSGEYMLVFSSGQTRFTKLVSVVR